ncbi:MAG: DmsC/YnfH family molybdoenzyme membrane anchor subunit [Opitutaceae bacterium]
MVAPLKKQPTLALIDELLAEQQRLDTPVARFSQAHDGGTASVPASRYRDLIPLTAPKPGEQYAFEVDLDSCTGCKACVSACHSLNGLEDNETWRDVGLIVGGNRAKPFQQTVTTACHHCADPACLNGCPVLAYEKDPVTGIVRHLDDQCIGCQYCVLKCPYDVPKYSERLGIVRKCDMCHSRLAEGEAPACVQACPTQAIRIVTVITHSDSAARVDTSDFLKSAPDPAYTQPPTRYLTKRRQPQNLAAADAATLRPQPPHWPLVLMLTCIPLAVGFSTAAALLPAFPEKFVTYYATNFSGTSPLPRALGFTRDASLLAAIAAIAGALGLSASVFHLGKPLRAWRIFLGWRKSWLSREAMVFGAWLPLAVGAWALPAMAPAAALVGLVGLACSTMIYVDTRRNFWRLAQTGPRLVGTAGLAGLVMLSPRAAAFALLVKLAWETRTFYDGGVSARLQRGPLRAATSIRDIFALSAMVLLIAAPGWLAIALLFAGELTERYLFFRAVDAPKMPGVPS